MPIQNTTPINTYIGNNSTTEFAYDFYIQEEADISVYKDGVLVVGGYTIAGVGNSLGGTVTFDTAPATDVVVRIERITELKREIDYAEGGGLQADILDGDVDRVVAMTQELDRRTLQENSDANWDANSMKLVNVATPTDSNDAVTKAYADAVITTASTYADNAATSATNAATSETNTAAIYDSFDDRYLGDKASDPTLDNDGDALLDGALYWNTTDNEMRVYDLGNTTWVTAYIPSNTYLRKDTSDTHTGSFTPTVNNTYNLGSASFKYANVYATTFHGEATAAQYADLAEMFLADGKLIAGTVVSFGGSEEVTMSSVDSDTAVAGVVSTRPAFLMNSALEGDNVVPVAYTGRVPCIVTGKIKKGDMLVSNGDGTARAENDPKVGSVLGKALEDSTGQAIIEIVVGRY